MLKRTIIYIVILTAVLLAPLDRVDVGKLRPVETVAISRDAADYVVMTDTGDRGRGVTLDAAITNLMETTPAVVYLDTARYLLLSKDSVDAGERLHRYFKGTVKLYSFRGEVDLEAASKYLSVHGNGPALKGWKEGEKLPVLLCAESRMKLSEK